MREKRAIFSIYKMGSFMFALYSAISDCADFFDIEETA